VKFLRPSDTAALSKALAKLHIAQPTYREIGTTFTGDLPEGYHHDRYEAVLGEGLDVFHAAVRGLKTWEAHRLPGIRVFPERQEVTTGATVIVTLGSSVLALAAPCRIVSVIDGQTRWGFAYGTLPGHPETGEEAFAVSISPDGIVTFEIVAFSRPADLLVRLSGPIGRGIQRGGTNGYLRALRRFVDQTIAAG
jgi:uncharacterized protein (UPF0548 family)